MPPIVSAVLQGLFLLLLYVFVARAVRWVIRDVSAGADARAVAAPAPPAREAGGATARRRARVAPSQLVVHLPDAAPRVLRLDEGDEVTFGRAPVSTVVLGDPYASEQHAAVYLEGGSWVLADRGSTNGTFLNSVKITAPTPLQAGDQVGIGKTVVEVRR